MTVRLPKRNVLDKILALFGKIRRLKTSGIFETYKKFGPYVQIKGQFESFWKALLRKVKK